MPRPELQLVYTDKVRDADYGTEFEEQFAVRNGIRRVPGSGSQWHSKLDVHGRGARWSLKSTKHQSFSIGTELIRELVIGCLGSGGSGDIPLGAVELDNRDTKQVVVFMREEDFRDLMSERMELSRETKGEARRREASVPQLLREER